MQRQGIKLHGTDSCGDAEIIVSEGRCMEDELLVYYVILTMWLFPDKDKTFGYTELVQCLAFSLSCIKSTLASVSGRSFETGAFLYFLPLVSISPYVLETWKILDPFRSILGQKALCSKVKLM